MMMTALQSMNPITVQMLTQGDHLSVRDAEYCLAQLPFRSIIELTVLTTQELEHRIPIRTFRSHTAWQADAGVTSHPPGSGLAHPFL